VQLMCVEVSSIVPDTEYLALNITIVNLHRAFDFYKE